MGGLRACPYQRVIDNPPHYDSGILRTEAIYASSGIFGFSMRQWQARLAGLELIQFGRLFH